MAETLFLQARVHLSVGAYRRWLKSVTPPCEDRQPTAAPLVVQDLLLAFLSRCATGDTAWLLCRHDKAVGQLQFAAALRHGREASSWTFAMQLVAAVRAAATFKPRRSAGPKARIDEDDYCFYGDAGVVEQAFSLNNASSATRVMTADSPSWIKAWFDMLGKSPPFSMQAEFIDSALLKTFKKQVNMAALAASPGQPVQVGFHFSTDSHCIWRNGLGRTEVAGADPGTFRLVGGDRVAAFYADRAGLWFCTFADAAPQHLQDFSHKANTRIKEFHLDPDAPRLVLCGDNAWTLRRASPRASAVDGNSFESLNGVFFRDKYRIYQLDEVEGLTPREDLKPATARRLGRAVDGLLAMDDLPYRYGQRLMLEGTPDLNSLHLLSALQGFYADTTQVWHHQTLLHGTSPADFRIEGDFAIDPQRVWYRGQLVPHAVGAGFRRLGDASPHDFWCDAQHVYHADTRLEGAHPLSFERIGNTGYSRQGGLVWFADTPVDGVDADSFTVDSMSAAHDRLHAYEFGRPSLPHEDHRLPDKLDMKNIPVADLRDLGAGIVVHNGLVYRHGKRLKIDADLKTLRVIEGAENFYADAFHVWDFSSLIDNADPAHFRVDGCFSMDLKQLWYESRVVVGVDPVSFRWLGTGGVFWSDKRHLYALDNRIDDVCIADIDQFKPYGDSQYARYKDRVYHGNEWILGADAGSFEVDAKHPHRARDRHRSYLLAQSLSPV